MEGDVDERAVVNDTRRVGHLFTTSEGGLTDGDLPLVGVTHDVVGLEGLGDLTQKLVGIPLTHLTHVACLMVGSGIVVEGHEGAEGVGVVSDKNAAVGTCFLADDEVGTCHRISGSDEHDGKNQISFHTFINILLMFQRHACSGDCQWP